MSDLTDAVARVNAAATLMEGANGRITAHENALKAAYNAIIASQIFNCWVDSVAGLDTNLGTQAAPLKTIGAAVAKTPLGGICVCTMANNYTVSARIVLNGIKLFIVSDTSVNKRQFFFERQINNNSVPVSRFIGGFDFRSSSNLVFGDMDLTLPALDGTWGTFANLGACSPFSVFGQSVSPAVVGLQGCVLTVPATIFASLFNSCLAAFFVNNTTTTGSLNGKIHPIATNTAGVASNTVANILQTNLATV